MFLWDAFHGQKKWLTYIDSGYIIKYVDDRYIDFQYKKGDVGLAGDKNQVSGNTAMLLLRLLSEKDMYGYEMIEELLHRSNHVFDLKAGTLYPLLHGMEARNQLVSYEKEAGGKTRRYYRITKEGRKLGWFVGIWRDEAGGFVRIGRDERAWRLVGETVAEVWRQP